jgi:hypothetical protein
MIKLNNLLKEGSKRNPYYSEREHMGKLSDILMDLDDILDDSTDYYDRKEMKKFDDDALYYIDNDLYKKNIKADDLKNSIDAVVKFYENAINNKIKKKLDLMKKEANSLKAKIK